MDMVSDEDHPAANGRDVRIGERQWNLDFQADTGANIRIHVGAETRDKLLAMLSDDAAKVVTAQNVPIEFIRIDELVQDAAIEGRITFKAG